MFDEILETAEEFTAKALSIMLIFIFWGIVIAITFHAITSMFDSVVESYDINVSISNEE